MSTQRASRPNPAPRAPGPRARQEPHSSSSPDTHSSSSTDTPTPSSGDNHSADSGAELFRLAATRPENELLLLCARALTGGASSPARVRELTRAGLDWDYLYGLARRHAVLPLLFRGLESHARGASPTEFAEALRAKCRESAARGALLSGELARVAALFDAEGVPVLAYKGPALALQAYGEVSLRRFVDLDLVVGRRDASRALSLLSTLGYARPERLTESHERFLLRRQHAIALERDGGRALVELHWEIAPAAFADFRVDGRVWERAASVELFGRAVKCLSPEDALLALCVHGTKHLWERLSQVCDVAALVNAYPELDWSYVQSRADESRVARMLSVGLFLATSLLGARLPEGLRDARSGKVERALAAEVVKGLSEGADHAGAGLFKGVAFNLRARARLRERLGYLRFVLTPTDGDLTAAPLPPRLFFLYYLLRPLRLALKREAE